MKEINTNMYIVIDEKKKPIMGTLSHGKSNCLKEFSKPPFNFDWEFCRSIGYKCIKLDVHMMPSSNLNA